jgi:Xaa-Pro dipeptidase
MTSIRIEEYHNRLVSIQKEMESQDLDLLLVYSWKRGQVRYISGYYPNYIANVALVAIPRQGDPALRIRFPFDMERAQRESWIKDISPSGNVARLAQEVVTWVLKNGVVTEQIGLVTGDDVIDELPYTLYRGLEEAFPNARFVDARNIFCKARMLKSDDEFALLRRSARVADAGMEAVRRALKSGVSEYEIVAAAEAQVRRLGGDNCLAVISSKGVNELIGPPTPKSIQEGDNVIFELAVECAGYWTQVVRVFYIGGPTPEQRNIYKATHQAYLAAVQASQLGNTCAQVANAARDFLHSTRYGEYIEHDFGHGIGLDLPELPRIDIEDTTFIEPGMVLVIHPSVRVPEVGGAFVGGTVFVHDQGPEPIHDISPEPIEVR